MALVRQLGAHLLDAERDVLPVGGPAGRLRLQPQRVELRRAVAVRPPDPRLGDAQVRHLRRREAQRRVLPRRKPHRFLERDLLDAAPHDPADRLVGHVPDLRGHGELRGGQGRQRELAEHVRVPERERTAVGQVHVSPQAHVLVRGGGVPVHPHEGEVVRLRGEDLHRHRVGPAHAREAGHVELVAPEGSRHFVGGGDALAVEPDVRPVVDPVEVKREGAAGSRRRHRELRAVPPRGLEGAVRGHGEEREALADGVRRPRDRPQVLAEVRISVRAVLYERPDDRVRHRHARPALRRVSRPRENVSLGCDLRRGLDRPPRAQVQPVGRCGAGGNREDEERCGQERPRPLEPRLDEERADAGRQREQAHRHVAPARRHEDVRPAHERDDRGNRIEPHLERAGAVGQPLAQERDRDDLSRELDDDPRRDERGDDLIQREERRDDRHRPQDVERDVGELLGRMDVREGLEEVALGGRRERDARVAEEEGEDRAERGPQDDDRHRHRRSAPVEPLHELRDDELRVEHLPPRHHAEERQVEQEVAHRAAEDREEDRARDHARRVADLVADVADVVVAEVVVDRDEGRAAQAEDEPAVEVERARREVERPRRVEVGKAAGEDGHHRDHGSRPQRHGDPA